MSNIHMIYTSHRMKYFPDVTFKALYAAVAPRVKKTLVDLFDEGLVADDEQITFYVGMADGGDIAGAGGALEAKKAGYNVKVVPAMPYPGFGESFRDPLMAKYRKAILERCGMDLINVSRHRPSPRDTKEVFKKLYHDRNVWMVRQSIINQEAGDMALGLCVWSGRPSGTANTVKLMEDAEIHWENLWEEVASELGLVADLAEVDAGLIVPGPVESHVFTTELFRGRMITPDEPAPVEGDSDTLPIERIIADLQADGMFPQLQPDGTYMVSFDDVPVEEMSYTEADLRKSHKARGMG